MVYKRSPGIPLATPLRQSFYVHTYIHRLELLIPGCLVYWREFYHVLYSTPYYEDFLIINDLRHTSIQVPRENYGICSRVEDLLSGAMEVRLRMI